MKKQSPLAALIAVRRKAMGLSQKGLGERVRKSQSAVSAWEKGINGIAFSEFYSVARALNMSDDEIVDAIRLAGQIDDEPSAGEGPDGVEAVA